MEKNNQYGFGCKTFNKARMKERLPYPVYMKWKNAVRLEEDLDRETADAIAHAMKIWAMENGATHYSHWFSPLNGKSAKKFEAFMDRTPEMEPMIRFSGKELIKGEPDASSFPSGGMRSTFEARGYTYWDCTANSFILDGVLYIPTIFVAFTGETLDKRGPLLKAMNLVSLHGGRVANLFATQEHTYRLRSKVGLEQEFFLVDRKMAMKRRDLMNCGRTLIGAHPPKDQEMDIHYYGTIPHRVAEFYRDVNKELWRLGIYAKTEHNEVAPGQFELAVLFENANVSIDNNLLVMSILQETALKHDLLCLLHEKPFDGVNGSGKHNNYSLTTNYGLNLFDPGERPQENLLFLLSLAAMIAAVDKWAPLLRLASSQPSNDARLGGQEAPPPIISIFLGDDLEDILAGVSGEKRTRKKGKAEIKVNSLAYIPGDKADRNRTSPFAFTGNKFEFRMPGSSMNTSDVNIVLNTAMGDEFSKMADRLEGLDEDERRTEGYRIVEEILKNHGRVLYSGDNYSQAWTEEAKRRGLPILPTYYDALQEVRRDDVVKLFEKHGIFTARELEAMYNVSLESVIFHHQLEGRTLAAMITKDILPLLRKEVEALDRFCALGASGLAVERKEELIRGHEELLNVENELYHVLEDLPEDEEKRAEILQQEIPRLLQEGRRISDHCEKRISAEHWTLPDYEDLFRSVL